MSTSFDRLNSIGDQHNSGDKQPERRRYETAVIAKAHADIAAGLGIDNECFEAWLDALETDENTDAAAEGVAI